MSVFATIADISTIRKICSGIAMVKLYNTPCKVAHSAQNMTMGCKTVISQQQTLTSEICSPFNTFFNWV